MNGPPPAPHGRALEFVVECSGAASARFGRRHDAAILPDWTVATPHDLEAERVAHALGGWSSCVALVDTVVPAYRHLLQVMARSAGPVREVDGSWRSTDAAGCAGQHVHGSLLAAVRHELEARHLAALFGAEPGRVARLVRIARRTWIGAAEPGSVVSGMDGYGRLWDSGIHPDRVAQLSRIAPAGLRPLPVDLLLGVEYGGIDHAWLAEALPSYPTPTFAEWAVTRGGPGTGVPGSEVARYRELGLAEAEATMALEAGIRPRKISEVAGESAASSATVVRWLACWSAVGCSPNAGHFRVLRDERILHARPDVFALDALCRAVEDTPPPLIDRTELGVMLAIDPRPGKILDAVRRGVRAATDPRFDSRNRSGRRP